MDKNYLRELAEEGAAIHSDPQPEREVCDGLIWALDEIERLRGALRGLLDFPSGQYSEGDGYDEACDSALAALTPNAEFSGPPTLAGDPEAAKVRVYVENLEAEIERIRAALLGLLAFDLENDGATCDWPELQVAIKAARGLGLGPNAKAHLTL